MSVVSGDTKWRCGLGQDQSREEVGKVQLVALEVDLTARPAGCVGEGLRIGVPVTVGKSGLPESVPMNTCTPVAWALSGPKETS